MLNLHYDFCLFWMKRLLVLTFGILTIGLLPVLLGIQKLGLFDFTAQQIPFIIETKRMLASGAPWWSWNTFLGENFLAGYSFYTLTSPFVWIATLFPYKYILWGILLNLYLKTGCTALFSYWYFRKMEFKEDLAITGAVLYAFSSFYICNLYFFHFAEPIMLFPLLLIALENVFRSKRHNFIYLSLITFAIVFINYYFAISSLILGFLYFIFRGAGLKKLTPKLTIKAVTAVILGVLMASFILLPVASYILGTPRAVPGATTDTIGATEPGFWFKMLSKYLPRVQSLFVPAVAEASTDDSILDSAQWISTEGFITVFGLFPASIYFIKKRNWLGWLIVLLAVIYLTPLNGMFYLFTMISYGRWLYGFLLLVILASLYVTRDRIEVSKKALAIYILLTLVIVGLTVGCSWYIVKSNSGTFTVSSQRWYWLIALILNLTALAIWVFNRESKRLLLAMAVVCVTFNLYAFTRSVTGTNESKMMDTILYCSGNQSPEGMEWRTDIISTNKNIGMVMNSTGIYNYHSVFNKNLVPLRSTLDPAFTYPSFNLQKADRASSAALFSVREVREFIGETDDQNRYERGLRPKGENEIYKTYEFEYYIPMGFAYDTFVPTERLEEAIAGGDSLDVPGQLLANLAIRSEDIPALSPYMTQGEIVKNVDLDSVVGKRRENVATDFKGTSTGFTCRTDFETPKVMFFSVAADEGFTARIDGDETEIYPVNLGMSAIIVPAGPHNVSFSYFPPGLKTGIVISILSFLILMVVFVWSRREVLRA